MTVKTDVSRFHIHDELTAPDGSAPLIKSIQTAGGAVSKFIGVLAESPAALRGYTRLRTELRSSKLPRATRERIGLAVAEWRDDPYTLTQYARTARVAGLGLDEVARARNFTSSDEKEAALLTLIRETLVPTQRPPTTWSRRPVRPAGATRRSSTRSPRQPSPSSRACSPPSRRCRRRATRLFTGKRLLSRRGTTGPTTAGA